MALAPGMGERGILVVVLPSLLVLPGLDGTGALLEPFVAAASSSYRARALHLPEECAQSYTELLEWLHARLPDGPVVLVAESFSGPLAILAARRWERVVGLVLSTSFVERPLTELASVAARRLPPNVWNHPPPEFVLRRLLTGGDAALAATLRQVLAGVSGKLIAERLAVACAVDVSAEFRQLCCPLLCLHAGRERLLNPSSSLRLRALQPDAEHVQISDAPHLLLQSRAREAWGHVSRFLQRVAPAHSAAS